MERKITLVLSILIFALIANPLLMEIQSAKASYAGVGWGHLSSPYSPDEYVWEYTVTDYICYDFNYASWDNLDAYWNLTTQSNVVDSLYWMQNDSSSIDWATTWWVGDYLSDTFYSPGYGTTRHYGFNGYGGDNIWDFRVWSAINSYSDSKQYFNFIWTCVNGGKYWDNQYGDHTWIEGIDYPDDFPGAPPENTHTYYGYYDSENITGAVGMPYAFTDYTPTMDNDYCYVGFETTSPFLENIPPAGWTSTNYEYGYFPYYFYAFALGIDFYGYHGTIMDSLDYAAYATFGHDQYNNPYYFANSILNHGYWFYTDLEGMEGWWYWKMQVFGNSDIYLPYA
ncbi:MAG: hypothetical protein NWF05_02785 [Candidatus Bathyarchaeota archaeon]|nr:hypothetical protein [Candidatus Bathyarchaeota archaeon]